MKEITEYIEKNVFPFYDKEIGKLYGDHARRTVVKSLEIAKRIDDKTLDQNMIYTIAAYHDIGLVNGKPNHEKLGAQMFLKDVGIQKFFSPDQIKTIADAIEDHRASNNSDPRTIYGKIISTADRLGWLDIDESLKVMYQNRIKNKPELSLEEKIEDARQHVLEKYSAGGYADGKFYFPDPKNEFEKFRRALSKLARDPKKFRKRFLKNI